MYTQLSNCPLCGSGNHTPTIIVEDHAYSKESFSIHQCSTCDFLFTSPIPSDLSRYYNSSDYISHKTKFTSITDLIYKLVRNYSFHYKYKIISTNPMQKTILDVGCGTGEFLKYLKRKDWDISGIEKSDVARKAAENTLGISVKGDLHHENSEYDVVTLWHVLEHLPHLDKTIQKLKSLLSSEGFIYIALPNCNSYDCLHYKNFWAGYDVPRHLYHFNADTFLKLATKSGMEVVSTFPMYFDSYYVSLLSEKYMGTSGFRALYRALSTGRKSNRIAKRSMDYSSLIYKCKIR